MNPTRPDAPSPAVPTDAADAAAVLDFWFAGDPQQTRAQWFRKDPEFDAQIAARFGDLINTALADGLQGWEAQLDTALARIVVLDQFTRNCFRGQARAFAGDALALAGARALVDRGADRALTGPQRQFLYLPFEHSESLQDQARSVALFQALALEHPAQAGLVEWAQRHQVIIERFGRFPHRNAALARTSTQAEVAFLAEPGSGF